MLSVPKKLALLRSSMEKHGYTAYFVPTGDFHLSEYVGDHFKTRAWLSGFTGSAGTLVVTSTEAALWVDGRYFIQAEEQLADTDIVLMKQGEPNVPTVAGYLETRMQSGEVLGMDGRTVSASIKETFNALIEKGIKLAPEFDLIDEIWATRPAISMAEAFILEEKYAGESMASKLFRVREAMAAHNADAHIIATLDDIAWLTNLRSSDVLYNPVLLSYMAIEADNAYLFVEKVKINAEVEAYLTQNGVQILPYNDIYRFVKKYDGVSVLASYARINFALRNALSEANVINRPNPTVLMKAQKNEVELANLRNSHTKDGVAMVKFMKWLKENLGKLDMTEISVSDVLENFRREQEGNLGLSFDTICGYGAHGAIVHYSATPQTDAKIEQKGLLLVDSGGQYYDGTTDITRTFAVGELTEEQKLHFATVLRSMMNLAAAKFLHGVRGMNLDVLARGPFWEQGLDYKHGTGHGIGFLLNVHEAPNGFRWQTVPEREDSAILEHGMVSSDEPGVYIAGSHGIRLENEIVTLKGEANEFGQFMYFETITYCPIDLDAVCADYLTQIDKDRLNAYHKMVYDKLAPHLNADEQAFLAKYTRAI